VKGAGEQINYGMRVYDPRTGRFLSVDPFSNSYPWYTPYQYAGNKPIAAVDLDGLEEYVVIYYKDQQSSISRIEVRTAVSIKSGKLLDQDVHKMGDPSHAHVAKGNVLVFESTMDKNNREQLKIVDSRNTPSSALTNQEQDVYKKYWLDSYFKDESRYLAYPTDPSINEKDIQYGSQFFNGSLVKDVDADKIISLNLNLAGHIFIGNDNHLSGLDYQGKPATQGELDMTSKELKNQVAYIKRQISSAGNVKSLTISVVGVLGSEVSSSADPKYDAYKQGLQNAGEQIKRMLLGSGVSAKNIIIGTDAQINTGKTPGVTATITAKTD
jgi:uncharacterized protein RhaS with RHS repeats